MAIRFVPDLWIWFTRLVLYLLTLRAIHPDAAHVQTSINISPLECLDLISNTPPPFY